MTRGGRLTPPDPGEQPGSAVAIVVLFILAAVPILAVVLLAMRAVD